jgi:hypothetical protein
MMGLYDSGRPDASRPVGFTEGAIPVAVYGLGKIGLPLAAVYAETTGNVRGVDVDELVVRTVNRGESHLEHEPGMDELIGDQVERGALRATTDGLEAATEAGAGATQAGMRTGGKGRIIGPAPETARARAALASLYVALMTGVALDLLCSRAEIVIDGALVDDPLFAGLIAAVEAP